MAWFLDRLVYIHQLGPYLAEPSMWFGMEHRDFPRRPWIRTIFLVNILMLPIHRISNPLLIGQMMDMSPILLSGCGIVFIGAKVCANVPKTGSSMEIKSKWKKKPSEIRMWDYFLDASPFRQQWLVLSSRLFIWIDNYLRARFICFIQKRFSDENVNVIHGWTEFTYLNKYLCEDEQID